MKESPGRRAWLWVPGLWLAALAANFGPLGFSPYLLIVPLAAMLGARCGRRGLWLVALGGLPLLPPAVSYVWLTKVAALDVYLVALAVCALAADGRPLAQRLPRLPRPPALAAALVVLPVAFSLWGTDFGGPGGWRIGLTFSFVAIFYFGLFLLGWSGFPGGWTAAALALATAAGMWLETVLPADGRALFGGPAAELPLVGTIRLHHLWWDYRLDTPAAFLTALAWFGAGRLWARLLATRSAPLAAPWAYALVLGLVALALGSLLNREMMGALGLDPRALARPALVLGSSLALPLAGLAAGLLLGKRGVLSAVAAVLAFWALNAWLLDFKAFAFSLQEPLVAAGFGLFGARLHEHALGITSAWPVRRWVLVGALGVLAVSFVVEAGSLVDLVLRALGLAAVAVAAFVLRWLRGRLGGVLKINREAWMAVLAAALFVALLVGHAPTLAKMLASLTEDGLAELWEDIYRARDETVVVAGVLVGLGFTVCVLEAFIRNLRAVLEDVASWTKAARLGGLAESGFWARVAAGARWARIAAFAAAALPFVAAAAYALYPEEGIVAAVRGVFEEKREPPAALREPSRAEPKPMAHPLLWQAALEAVKGFPLVESDAGSGRLVTGWKGDPGTPDVRTKMSLRVGRELQSYALSVELERQKRVAPGIWVQQEKYWDPKARKSVGYDTWPERQKISKEILARAAALEKKDSCLRQPNTPLMSRGAMYV